MSAVTKIEVEMPDSAHSDVLRRVTENTQTLKIPYWWFDYVPGRYMTQMLTINLMLLH